RYLADGTAARAQKRRSLSQRPLSEQKLAVLRGLNDIAAERGQTLAQMALQWTLRDPVVASALVGASRPEQLDENIAAVDGPPFSEDELTAIDAIAVGVDVDLWSASSDL